MTQLLLDVPPNFNFEAAIHSHGWRQLAPFYFNEERLFFTLRLSTSGRVTLLNVSNEMQINSDLILTVDEQARVTADVRRMFNVDVDLTEFYERIRHIPRYAWVESDGAGRFLRAPTVWEDLVKILLTTNVSWSNTVGMVERLVVYGDVASNGSHAFPTPQQIAEHHPDMLNETIRVGYRIKSLHSLALLIANGDLDVEVWAEQSLHPQELYQNIVKLHGFGTYAAGSMMRLLGYYDWLALDSVARTAYATLHNNGEKAPDAEIEAFYAPFGKWKGLAIWMDILKS